MGRRGRTGENGESGFVTGISEGDSSSGSKFEGVDLLGGDVESDGHGEEGSVGQSQRVDDAEEGTIELVSSFSNKVSQ